MRSLWNDEKVRDFHVSNDTLRNVNSGSPGISKSTQAASSAHWPSIPCQEEKLEHESRDHMPPHRRLTAGHVTKCPRNTRTSSLRITISGRGRGWYPDQCTPGRSSNPGKGKTKKNKVVVVGGGGGWVPRQSRECGNDGRQVRRLPRRFTHHRCRPRDCRPEDCRRENCRRDHYRRRRCRCRCFHHSLAIIVTHAHYCPQPYTRRMMNARARC